MGLGPTREEELLQLDDLPLVKNRYLPLSLLGGGAFGRVFKVQDVRTKQLYALKTVPFTPYRSGVTAKQRRVIIRSAETECQLLEALDHPNVVNIVDYFIWERSPIQPIHSIRNPHLCILIEYCHGSDLNDLLRLREKQESQFTLPKDRFRFPKDLTLLWFIKILKTLEFIHSKNIIHRDLKPDNILVCYETLEDYKNMELKLSDFGVGKDIGGGELGRTISGQLFYTAPEVLKQDVAYDSRCDMWSFALIFLQVYACLSIGTYQDAVGDIFEKIKTNPRLRQRFAKRYGLSVLKAEQNLLPLLNFMHENDLFHILTDRFVDDPGVRKVIDVMLCSYDRRLKASAVLEMPIVKTWEYVLDRSASIQVDEFDMEGVITILKIKDQILLNRCFDILKDRIDDEGVNGRNVEVFVEVGGGLEILFERVGGMRSLWKQRWLENIISVFVKIVNVYLRKRDESAEEEEGHPTEVHDGSHHVESLHEEQEIKLEVLCRKVTGLIRQYDFVPILMKLFQMKNSAEIYFFTYMLTLHSPSLCLCLTDLASPALLKMNRSNEVFLLGLLQNLAPALSQKQLQQLLELYDGHRVHFFAWARPAAKTPEMCLEVAKRLIFRIQTRDVGSSSGSDADSPNPLQKRIRARQFEKDILGLLYVVRDQYLAQMKVHGFQLSFPNARMTAKSAKLKVSLKPDVKNKPKPKPNSSSSSSEADTESPRRLRAKEFVELSTVSGLRSLKCVSDDRSVFVDLHSSHPVCVVTLPDFVPDDELEKALGYFEVEVKDGGMDEDLFLGFQVGDSQAILNCASGQVGVWDGRRERAVSLTPLDCSAGAFVGAGVTNKGAVFFTANNVLLQPFVNKFLKMRPDPQAVHAHLKLKGNKFFHGIVNFGKIGFHYRFASVTPEISSSSSRKRPRPRRESTDEAEGPSSQASATAFAGVDESICQEILTNIDPNLNSLKVIQASLKPESLGFRVANRLFQLIRGPTSQLQIPGHATVPDSFLSAAFSESAKMDQAVITSELKKSTTKKASAAIGSGFGSAMAAISARYANLKKSSRETRDLGDLHRRRLMSQSGADRRKTRRLANVFGSRNQDSLLSMLPDGVLGLLGEESDSDDDDLPMVRRSESEGAPVAPVAAAKLESVATTAADSESDVAVPSEDTAVTEPATEPTTDGDHLIPDSPKHPLEISISSPSPVAPDEVSSLSSLLRSTAASHPKSQSLSANPIDRIRRQERFRRTRARRGSVALILNPERSKVSSLFAFPESPTAEDEQEEEGEVSAEFRAFSKFGNGIGGKWSRKRASKIVEEDSQQLFAKASASAAATGGAGETADAGAESSSQKSGDAPAADGVESEGESSESSGGGRPLSANIDRLRALGVVDSTIDPRVLKLLQGSGY